MISTTDILNFEENTLNRLIYLLVHFVVTESCQVLKAEENTFALGLLLQYSMWRGEG